MPVLPSEAISRLLSPSFVITAHVRIVSVVCDVPWCVRLDPSGSDRAKFKKGVTPISTETIVSIILSLIVGAVVGAGVFELFRRRVTGAKQAEAEELAKQVVQNAQREAENVLKEARFEAKDLAFKAKSEFEQEQKAKLGELSGVEKRLIQREGVLDGKLTAVEKRESEARKREQDFAKREEGLAAKETACAKAEREHREALERVAGMTAEEAKKQLIVEMESQAKLDAVGIAKRTIEEARENAEREAREIITSSIQRVVRDYVSESTISVVPIPNDAMKGRIIGREGRNIRALEAATGIDLIIDETPEAVIISGFDPLRREIAKVSLERLMHDGRIHPTRIEEIVEKVKVDIDKLMYEEAEKIIFELGLSDFNPELIKVLGRLKYRTSYGQNNLYHAREASYICGIMASELGLDVKLARRGALLHDIGKAVSHEEEGPHAMLGAEIAKKYGESAKIVNAIAAHHEQVEPICPESVLVAAAEALSAARPGARREALESYVKRLEKLESLATGHKGVQKAYAIQAGREIRVIVRQEDITDSESFQLSRELAKKIEQELTYPGQIKVTVIRESRYVEYAK
ncbi:Ribonuclease Y [Candidatus Nitrospira nitrosa]|jgi:ribonuclease Y|uniref:Ribonuclease Y n=1 Tax=Candidatus Nitrospira nitrosa TaxID=1742972 RepID=A0A0S4L6W1_9BACT|nr:ribonuclease Y [Candidatus Nitrospira nitrosa]CUS32320.1 Ribonuclease Y [Candidatus Nitrospira nitrosa]